MTPTGATDSTGPVVRPSGLLTRSWKGLWARVLYLSLHETLVATRGFAVESPRIAKRIEDIGATFAQGFNGAMRSVDLGEVMQALAPVPVDDCGFAFEGAAMGLAVADFFSPRRQLFEAFVSGPGRNHEYMAWVGLGWSFARLPVSPAQVLKRHRSIHKWLALDGYGFHEGYFCWRRSVLQQRRPRSMCGDEGQVFDQGLGRSLWFVFGADPMRIADTIAGFAPGRQSDLWSGVGLAATYAGGVAADALQTVIRAAGLYRAALTQGVVFAAEARRRAGNPVPHSELACRLALGLSLPEAADIAVRCRPSDANDLAAYQAWRAGIQTECAALIQRPAAHPHE